MAGERDVSCLLIGEDKADFGGVGKSNEEQEIMMKGRIFVESCESEIVGELGYVTAQSDPETILMCMPKSTLRRFAELAVRHLDECDRDVGRNVIKFEDN